MVKKSKFLIIIIIMNVWNGHVGHGCLFTVVLLIFVFNRVIPHYLSVDSFDLATYKLVVARTSPLCLSSSSFLLSGSILIRLHALFTL